MRELNDEMLMAYADGELDAEGRKLIEARLAEDPEIGRLLNIFVTTREPLARVFDQPMREPVPERLLQLLAFSEPAARPAELKRDSLATRLQNSVSAFFTMSSQIAVAAPVFALVIVAGAVWLLSDAGQQQLEPGLARSGQGLVAVGPMRDALETAPSGASIKWDGGSQPQMTMKTVFSFLSRDGAYCRHYGLATGDKRAFAGIACRESDGTWRIAVHTATEAARSAEQGTVPAAGPGQAVADALDRMMDGETLTKEEESNLTRNGWRRKP
jgi:surface antigen